jgi:hypothetical protein
LAGADADDCLATNPIAETRPASQSGAHCPVSSKAAASKPRCSDHVSGARRGEVDVVLEPGVDVPRTSWRSSEQAVTRGAARRLEVVIAAFIDDREVSDVYSRDEVGRNRRAEVADLELDWVQVVYDAM